MTVKYEVSGGFFGRYQELVRDVVIPYQEKALLDEIPDAEKSHAVENFRQAAQMLREGHCDGAFYGMVFQDSDVAKWLEAAAYSLGAAPGRLPEHLLYRQGAGSALDQPAGGA